MLSQKEAVGGQLGLDQDGKKGLFWGQKSYTVWKPEKEHMASLFSVPGPASTLVRFRELLSGSKNKEALPEGLCCAGHCLQTQP